MTWEDMKVKYPECREDMSEEREKEFVNDCFEAYETEGFAKAFWSKDTLYKKYCGKYFEVIGRTPIYDGKNNGMDIESLPIWNIKFEDGTVIYAYPEEIIPREMKDNGCTLEGIE